MSCSEQGGLLAGPKVRFGELAIGDRFFVIGLMWTKLGTRTAREHSPASRALGAEGYGYHGDPVCSFDEDDCVTFVPLAAS